MSTGIDGIQAVIFDMDGTLVDSEPHTGRSVRELLADAGIDDPTLDTTTFYGRTWQSAADELLERHPSLGDRCTPATLDARFRQLWADFPPPPITGALEALRAARAHHRTAIATSSHRASVDDLFARLPISSLFETVVSAEDFARSKPDPECFLLAARRLGTEPSACLVFEDSIAGLQAAQSAGMRTVAITHRTPDIEAARALCTLAVPNYSALADGFFEAIS
jgi:HAD superfamily hydrolase (TIGR01509 family)